MANQSEEYCYALFTTPTNKPIIKELDSIGAKVVAIKPIEFEKNDLQPGHLEIIENLTDFDWVIFPDVLTVDYFIDALIEKEIDPHQLDFVQVCVVGEAVADRLRFSELHADIITPSDDPQVIFATLSNYLAGADISKLRILVIGAVSEKYELDECIAKSGAEVLSLPAYRVVITKELTIPKTKALFAGGAIDEFIFSDPRDVISLKHYFPGKSLEEILREVRISATDQAVFRLLSESGLRAAPFRLNRSINL